ncbi:MAG: 2-oxoacid:ferredoxin oxidoreductase subunit beta [Actinomycetales bacterium]|nr:2-oxoacid:ferredoxin oxidoreductase subunit beta [Actinomycetales bacterium]
MSTTNLHLDPTGRRPGLFGVPTLPEGSPKLTKKDFTSTAEVRWCPGCGDYAILAAFQSFLPELGVPRDNIVCVSGIGCSSRLPYYLDTYGMHSIHGRATAIATGLATTRPDLSVWVVTGDGDALSIGGNHLIHAIRRNVNMTILLFNNRIYGLTKGQYSPTSEQGKITKSSPMGTVDLPFNPVSLALGAEATFVARTVDSDRALLTSILRQAAAHRGTALIEIYQNCPIFNNGAYELLKDRDESAARLLRLEHGKPVRSGSRGVVRDGDGGLRIVDLDELGPDAESRLVVHDAHAADPSLAFALSRLESPEMAGVPVGVFRSVSRPAYDDLVRDQIAVAVDAAGGPATRDDLAALLAGNDTWTVG